MALATIDFRFSNNETWRRSFSVTRNGAPIDLQSAELRMDIAQRDKLSEVVLRLSSGSGLVVTDAAAGEFDLVVAHERTRDLRPGEYAYDMLIILPNEVVRPFSGLVTVVQGVTR